MRCLCVVALLLGAAIAVLTPEMVAKINAQSTWTSSLDAKFAKLSHEEASRLCGTNTSNRGDLPVRTFTKAALDAVPDTFDSRTNWPNCQSMKMIRDQSECGSCWAFGAVESMSDRECIVNGRDIVLSAEDMNSCSHNGILSCGSCNGGQDGCAWQYYVKTGVVTEDCAPYSLPGCDHHIPNSNNPCPQDMYPTPACPKTCTAQGQTWTKYKGSDAYSVKGMKNIMAEIYANGPCETSFTVYEDFLTYTGGIYQHLTGASDGGHAVKFVGWGSENGVDYWLVANSWNTNWGEAGFFRILRGVDECGIENVCNAGTPAKA